MVYNLTNYEGNEARLFFSMDGEEAERHGAVCNTAIDMEQEGCENMQRFYRRRYMETPEYKADLKRVVSYLRGNDMETPPLRSYQDFLAFCRVYGGQPLKGDGVNVPIAFGVKIQTDSHTYYLRVHPNIGKVNIHAYDSRYLLPELAGKHDTPNGCYSLLPSTGEIILIRRGEKGYTPIAYQTGDREENRVFVDAHNSENRVTRGQEEAMLAGSLFGWNTPAAKPWNYDPNGTPRPAPPKRTEPER